jgi:hypothetical protein
MKKRIMGAVVVLLFVSAGVFAQTENDFEVTLTADSEGVVITKYTGRAAATVTIPATIQDMPVREIGAYAFRALGR